MTLDEVDEGRGGSEHVDMGMDQNLVKKFPYFDGNHHGSSSNYQEIMTYTSIFFSDNVKKMRNMERLIMLSDFDEH